MPSEIQERLIRSLEGGTLGPLTQQRAAIELRKLLATEPRITPSEALYGFIGWLTSLEEPVTLSANHDAGIGADLVAEWLSANGFTNDDVRPIFPRNLAKPTTREFTEIDTEFISRFD